MEKWNAIDIPTYKSLFKGKVSVFHTAEFNHLNEEKVQNVYYLKHQVDSTPYGIILGEKEGMLSSPFSSPFGGFDYAEAFHPSDIYDIAKDLKEYGQNMKSSIRVTLPPLFYKPEFIESSEEALSKAGFDKLFTDVNYHLEIHSETNQKELLARNARKNLNKALKNESTLVFAKDPDDINRSYSIIKSNREERGFPLKLSLNDLMKTSAVVPIEFFTLSIEGNDCAAAVVYKIREDIAMVVYWGHLGEYSDLRPMNLLAYKLYQHYQNEGIRYLDIGPSSEHGVINEGLARFKESIGCKVTNKNTFLYRYE